MLVSQSLWKLPLPLASLNFPDLSGHSGLFTCLYPALKCCRPSGHSISSLGSLIHPCGSCCPVTGDCILHTLMRPVPVQTFPPSSRLAVLLSTLHVPLDVLWASQTPLDPQSSPPKLTSFPSLPVPLNGATIRPLPKPQPRCPSPLVIRISKSVSFINISLNSNIIALNASTSFHCSCHHCILGYHHPTPDDHSRLLTVHSHSAPPVHSPQSNQSG